ncbi:MAG: peptidase domain-containing ABC transporter [Glaciecola sp.]
MKRFFTYQNIARLNFNWRKKVPVVLQSESSECGLACLTMVANYYGKQISLREMRLSTPSTERGWSLQTMMQCTHTLGFSCQAYKLEINDLSQLTTPAILHWQFTHFVVLTKVTKRFIYINDPAIGKQKLSYDAFGDRFTGVALNIQMNANFTKQSPSSALHLFDFIKQSQGIGRYLIALVGLSLLLQVFALASPFYMQSVIDHVITSNSATLLTTLTLGFALLLLIDTSTQWLRETIMLRFSHQLNLLISSSVFAHLLGLPVSYFERRHMGDVVSRFGSLQPVRDILTQGLIGACIDGVLGVLTLLLMWLYSPQLTLIVLISTAIYCALRWAWYFPIKQLNQQILQSDACQQSVFMQSVRAIKTIKLSNSAQATQTKWVNHYVTNANQRIALGKWNINFAVCNKAIFGIENLSVIFIAVGLINQQLFSIGMLFAFVSYKSRFVGAAANLVDKWIEYKLLNVHLHRLEDILFTPQENRGSTQALLQSHAQAKISHHLSTAQQSQGAAVRIEGLSVRHNSRLPPVFTHINMHIQAGDHVAIVGDSGCGKSTLLQCIMGLLAPSEGQILVDNTVLNAQSRSQQGIAAVLQSDELLSGSILDNITNFAETTNIALAIACARLACIHDDIIAMTMQYQTLIGDMGSTLSGGQKQRIVLARALYQQPRLLVLDEATSHLDTKCEAVICANLKQLPTTTIMVAHRPQAIASANKVYTLSALALTEVNCTPNDGILSKHDKE